MTARQTPATVIRGEADRTDGRRPGAVAAWRVWLPVAGMAVGIGGSLVLFVTGAGAGLVLVPVSLAVLFALLVVPFPAADYLLALGMIGTFPLLPPLGLPNVPLALAVIVVALWRVGRESPTLPSRRQLLVLVAVWGTLAVGVAISHLPPLSIWLRPAVILGMAALACVLGVLVWRDPSRRARWIEGMVWGALVVTVSALIVFALQYVLPPLDVAEAVAESQGYLRGEAAAAKFEAQSNWIIWGADPTLRAVSPLFPAPNNVGGYLGVAGPLALLAWLSSDRPRARTVAAVVVALAVVVLVITYSRSSWVAAFCAGAAALAVMVLLARFGRRDALPTLPVLLRVGAVIVLSGVVGVAGIMTTANELAVSRLVDPEADQSVVDRVAGDEAAIERLQTNLLRGAGLGNWTGDPDSVVAERDPLRVEYVHNVYLQYAQAAGLFGMLWAILLVAVAVGSGVLAALAHRRHGSALPGLTILAIGVFAAVQFLFDDNLFNPQYAWLLAWAVGGGVAIGALRADAVERSATPTAAPT